jgi:hypothetical protein
MTAMERIIDGSFRTLGDFIAGTGVLRK